MWHVFLTWFTMYIYFKPSCCTLYMWFLFVGYTSAKLGKCCDGGGSQLPAETGSRASGRGGAADGMVAEEQAKDQEPSCLEGLYTSIIHSPRRMKRELCWEPSKKSGTKTWKTRGAHGAADNHTRRGAVWVVESEDVRFKAQFSFYGGARMVCKQENR